MTNYEIISTEKNRLDKILQKKLPEILTLEISNSKIRRLIMAGCVSINGRQIKVPSFIVFEKTKIYVAVDKEKLLYEKHSDDVFFEVSQESVLFEDEYLIFINKPTRFPTEKTIVQDRDNLHDAIVRYLWKKNPSLRNPPYVGIMHRLDRETSGVILFTKSRTVNKAIFDMFDSSKLLAESNNNFESLSRPIQKTYIAVVKDSPLIKDKFVVQSYLRRLTSKSATCKWGSGPSIFSKDKKKEKIFSEKKDDGLFSMTEFKVLKRENGLCYIQCHPITGRTHQIRVHLSESGFPILGDLIYGGEKYFRLMLHAKTLKLVHPVTNQNLEIEAYEKDFF